MFTARYSHFTMAEVRKRQGKELEKNTFLRKELLKLIQQSKDKAIKARLGKEWAFHDFSEIDPANFSEPFGNMYWNESYSYNPRMA